MINETTTEIVPNLHIGNVNVLSSAGIERLKRLGINRVLIVAKKPIPPNLVDKFQVSNLRDFKIITSLRTQIYNCLKRNFLWMAVKLIQIFTALQSSFH
jgi:hypothetical protein